MTGVGVQVLSYGVRRTAATAAGACGEATDVAERELSADDCCEAERSTSGGTPVRAETTAEGYVVRFSVEVVFDIDHAGERIDHVGTETRCTQCGAQVPYSKRGNEFVRHARSHERELCGPSPGARDLAHE